MAQECVLQHEIFIVDDDPVALDLLSTVFRLEGFDVASFLEGASFVAAAKERIPACVLLDVNLPGVSGLQILQELKAQTYPAPIFIISGQRDIPTAVTAIKNGALDFIEKPFDTDAVVSRVREAIVAWERRGADDHAAAGLVPQFPGRDLLTPREREVLGQIAGGASNKEAGRQLGISPRTIEVHRARIMEKLGAKNAADLVRIVLSEGRGQ
jgi:two-component system, LuxR family, response regulator FixJ